MNIFSFQPKPDKRDKPRKYKYSGETIYYNLFVEIMIYTNFQQNPFMSIKNSVLDKDKDSLAKKFLNGRSVTVEIFVG